MRDSGGMNYHPVATVTPRMQKPPCRDSGGEKREREKKKRWFVRFDSEKPLEWWVEGEGGRKWIVEERKEDWLGKRARKKRGWGQRRREEKKKNPDGAWLAAIRRQCFRQFGSLLSLYFYTQSRNTSSAIHFISIPTPASHLHSVSFASPFHVSACHYISWMITLWQFLRWHSPVQDTTPPASKAEWGEGEKKNGKPSVFSRFVSFFIPSPQVPTRLSNFHQQRQLPPSQHQLSVKSRSLLCDPCETSHGPVTPVGPLGVSRVSPLHGNKWLAVVPDVFPDRRAPRSNNAALNNRYRHVKLSEHIKASLITLDLTLFFF